MQIVKDQNGRLRCIVDLPGDKRSRLYLYGDKRKSEEDQIKDFILRLMEQKIAFSKVSYHG